ncbi:uncharacterized protein LOC125849345 isoform X2 [Solanum stenotomum]|uniref:uncharacterized protein LOC125849345 isoform X2 n=1 Tax=Solanum stenotomum TaxID=172797 RepID=UPI0020D00680|nr:uncharacterized protein LOC125849345 isoform X2 [Solanum stenotomum]
MWSNDNSKVISEKEQTIWQDVSTRVDKQMGKNIMFSGSLETLWMLQLIPHSDHNHYISIFSLIGEKSKSVTICNRPLIPGCQS